MGVRTRSRILSQIKKGTADRFTWTVDTSGGYTVNRAAETCVDISPSGGGGPLTVVRDYFNGGVINMPLTNYFAGYFLDYTNDYLTGGSWKQFHLGLDSPSDTDIANQVQASSNPSRPVVDMVASVLQLPQGLKTIRDNGREFFGKKSAETLLKYKFDIAPNVSDLIKILFFQGEVIKRLQELERLKKRGLHRTIVVGNYSNQKVEDYPVQSSNRFISVKLTTVTTERCWGYIVWTPDSDFPDYNADDMRRLAFRAVNGITFDAGTAWELIPWSWLMDWCTSFGTYFAATRNIIPAVPSSVQVMRETITRTSFGAARDDSVGLTMSAGSTVSERKLRTVKSPSVEAHLPLLDAGHASILGAIGVLHR